MFIYIVLLFVFLTPAILVRLPPNGNKWTVAFVHGIIFAIVYHFTHKLIWSLGRNMEGMEDSSNNKMNSSMPMPMPMH
jgi:hypothetical protein